MKRLLELRFASSVREGLVCIGIIAAMSAFFVSAVTSGALPSLFELLVGYIPFLLACFVVISAVLTIWGRERAMVARKYALGLVLAGCGVSVIAACVGTWNDGSLLAVLSPAQAVFSLLTFGIWPLSIGPIVLIRFLPVVFAVGVGWRWHCLQAPPRKIFLGSFATYALLSVLLHSLSWIAGVLAWSKGTVLSGAADAFRILVSAQSDGYWVRFQQDRFFAGVGHQAENGLMSVFAATLLVSLGLGVVMLWGVTAPAARTLGRRLMSGESVRLFSSTVLGFILARSFRPSGWQYSDVIAVCLSVLVWAAWVAWWRFQRDIDAIERDEREHPEFPLPSGAIAVHELEEMNVVLLTFVGLGSFVLGWPVCIAFVSATGVALSCSSKGVLSGGGEFLKAVCLACIAIALGWLGASVGMRDVLIPVWILRLLTAAACFVGFSVVRDELSVRVGSLAKQLVWHVAFLILGIAYMRQPVLWAPFLAAFLALLACARYPSQWRRWGGFPFDGLLVALCVLGLFLPQVFQRF